MEAGCLFWGPRVVIPKKYHQPVLAELHSSHPGIVRMKGLARSHVWWSGVDADIEQMVHNFQGCQSTRNQLAKAPLHSWPWAASVWERIHVDYAGPFMGLVVVDTHNKWLEIHPSLWPPPQLRKQ